MSDVPDSPNFEVFLEESAKREARREALALTINRFTLFLSERGVVFEPEEFMGLASVEERSVDGIEIQAMAALNKMHVLDLAVIKEMARVAAEHGKDLPEGYKKHLQAHEVAAGSTSPWLELIDKEFPGEPLNDEDAEILLSAVLERSETHELTQQQLEDSQDSILEFLDSIGNTKLNQDEAYAVIYFGLLHSEIYRRDRPGTRASMREDAQLFAIKRGFDMGVWSRVVEHFFGDVVFSSSQITDVVAETLFFLYDTNRLPVLSEVVGHIAEITGYELSDCQAQINKMLDRQYILRVNAENEDSSLAFGANGLWLLENSFMHGEEDIDSMALAERILRQSKFFD